MNTPLETLYVYACENRITYSHEDRLKCSHSADLSEQAKKELMEMLPSEGQRRFQDYIREEQLLQTLELESMFRAGLSIGLELSRLQ